ncbi:U-poneritoxin(01)-Om1a-like [Odontomachus brunneus]|uniref:U-poneritoxin(01)-Om1a-like n=1 Tax=Odontomachus brunneus TaxID=486640 RepID=UPI0013F1DD0D|nr:U-poneritoxin(01)-Om1a-like [Odontomachus brunneus]
MKPSGLTLAFLVVFMMALMYNSVEAAAKPDADAEAEALANAIATGDADAVAGILDEILKDLSMVLGQVL